VALAQSFDPYGNLMATTGTAQTIFGFDGEKTDSYIKLIDLRSRWYDPATGRFQTKDSWQGDYNSPQSLNQWNYVW
jgi:RHS repeat-associated protein